MSIRLVVTRGFGNGTFNGDIANVVTRGYTIGEFVPKGGGGSVLRKGPYRERPKEYHPRDLRPYDWDEPQPDAKERAKKPKRKAVKKAIQEIADAQALPQYFALAKEIIKERPTVKELMGDHQDLSIVMDAHDAYLEWQRQDEEDLEIILMLIN